MHLRLRTEIAFGLLVVIVACSDSSLDFCSLIANLSLNLCVRLEEVQLKIENETIKGEVIEFRKKKQLMRADRSGWLEANQESHKGEI